MRSTKSEKISLAEVATAVGASLFHFCKVFHKSTGLTFTNYLARVRAEAARGQLLNPNRRISEIAYDVGFQSLPNSIALLAITGSHQANSGRSFIPRRTRENPAPGNKSQPITAPFFAINARLLSQARLIFP